VIVPGQLGWLWVAAVAAVLGGPGPPLTDQLVPPDGPPAWCQGHAGPSVPTAVEERLEAQNTAPVASPDPVLPGVGRVERPLHRMGWADTPVGAPLPAHSFQLACLTRGPPLGSAAA
jgi:hypothetical protein